MELPKGLQGIISVQLSSTHCVPGPVLDAVESKVIETRPLLGGMYALPDDGPLVF